MELVPKEKLVVITTEKPILSPSNENIFKNGEIHIFRNT